MLTAVNACLEQLAQIVEQGLDLLRSDETSSTDLQSFAERREECFLRLQESWAAVSGGELSAETKGSLAEKAAGIIALDAQVQELARQHGDRALASLQESRLQREAQDLYKGDGSAERGVYLDRRDS